MRHNSTQLAACRPGEDRAGIANPVNDLHSERPYHKTAAVTQAYNEATEWEWLESKNVEDLDFRSSSIWHIQNIDTLLPKSGYLPLSKAVLEREERLTLASWFEMDHGWLLNEWGHHSGRWVSQLAKLPNPLLGKTIIRLFGPDELHVSPHGRIKLRQVDWAEVHGALWPGQFRERVETKVRALDCVTELLAE